MAINARDNIVHLITLSLLSVHRVAPDDVKLVVAPFPEMGDTLEKGEVHGALMIEPFISQRDFWAQAQRTSADPSLVAAPLPNYTKIDNST